MFKCPVQSEDSAHLLLDYCARRLDPGAEAVLEAHMNVCPECAKFRAGQQAVWAALDSWSAPEPGEDFNRRLYRRIDAEGRPSWWTRWLRPAAPWNWKPALPLAAACLIVAAGLIVQRPGAAPEDNGLTTVVAQPDKEAEQILTTLEDLEMLRELDLKVSEPPVQQM